LKTEKGRIAINGWLISGETDLHPPHESDFFNRISLKIDLVPAPPGPLFFFVLRSGGV